jgi:23S rRNA pseudouridine2605 synthase
MSAERLQKIIAQTGMASRREAERWIREGRVRVNGEVITALGTKVDLSKEHVAVDGHVIQREEKKYYYAFHKPRNVLVARSDPRKRPLIYDYLKQVRCLVHPVGRLDFDSEGLLLLTNDGPIIHRLTHPSSQTPKVYHVKVKGDVDHKRREDLLAGVVLDDGLAAARAVRVLKKNPHNTWLEIILTEGRNRQVRRMCEAIGNPALRLKRVAIGKIALDNLKVGEWRSLTKSEIKALFP